MIIGYEDIGLGTAVDDSSGATLRDGGVKIQRMLAELYTGIEWQTPAEIAAGVMPQNCRYAPGNVLRYGANTIPGTTDMTAALQASVNQQAFGGAGVYLPSGKYLITGTITPAQSSPFVMYGDGIKSTSIQFSGTTNFLNITEGVSAYNLTYLHDFSVEPLNAASKVCFNINGGQHLGAVTVRNVQVSCTGTYTFTSAFFLTDCGENYFERVFIYGGAASAATMTGVSVTSTVGGAGATVYKFHACSTYSMAFAYYFNGTVSPGLEGITFNMCDVVGCGDGVYVANGVVGYGSPQLTWVGGHMNCSVHCFQLSQISQVTILGALLYSSGPSSTISLTTCGFLNISENILISVGTGNNGIEVFATTTILGGKISNNTFYPVGSSSSAIYVNCANITNLTINNNARFSGGLATVTTIGTMASSIILQGNVPMDAIDIADNTLAGAATMSLVGIRATYCNVAQPAGAVSCSTLTSRSASDRVTLASYGATRLTLLHGTGGDGFYLSGGANYVFPAGGGNITLAKCGDPFWHEVSRA